MSASEERFVTSRSRTPSLIRVTSLYDNENVVTRESTFVELPDIIQEAAVSTECEPYPNYPARLRQKPRSDIITVSSPDVQINRAQDPISNADSSDFCHLTQPVFFISTRTDSGISMPDLHLTDEKL